MQLITIRNNFGRLIVLMEIVINAVLIALCAYAAFWLERYGEVQLKAAGYPPMDYHIWMALIAKPAILWAYAKAWAFGVLAIAIAIPLAFSAAQGAWQFVRRIAQPI